MSYYGAGDYYARGGILDAIGKVAGGVIRAGVGFVTGGPLGAVRSVLPTFTGTGGGGSGGGGGPLIVNPPFAGPPGVGITTGGGMQIGFGQPGAAEMRPGGKYVTKAGTPRRIRRDGQPWDRPTMDPGNSKALRRASRRMDRFIGIARGALKHTNYKVVSKSAGKGRKRK